MLLDDRPGNCSQVLGVGRALQHQTNGALAEWRFSYNWFGRWPNILRGCSLKGVVPAFEPTLTPDIIIGAGRRMAPLARGLKKRYPQAFLCHILWPETGIKDFDLIALPLHDKQKYQQHHNTFFTKGAAGKMLPGDFGAMDAQQFAHLPRPHTTVLIGGRNKHNDFTIDQAKQLARQLCDLQKKSGGSLLISTSRRSGAEQAALIKQQIVATPHYFYDWQSTEANPYQALLKTADQFVVTDDSVSMLSECLVTGKPTYLAPISQHNPFAVLHDALKKDSVTVLGQGTAKACPPIVVANDIASHIITLRKQQNNAMSGA